VLAADHAIVKLSDHGILERKAFTIVLLGAHDEFVLAATAQNLRKLAKLIPMPQPKLA